MQERKSYLQELHFHRPMEYEDLTEPGFAPSRGGQVEVMEATTAGAADCAA